MELVRWRWTPMLVAAILVAGCQPDRGRQSAGQLQDEVLADPFSFGPKPGREPSERSLISGGGIDEFDREGFKRDMRTVFDP